MFKKAKSSDRRVFIGRDNKGLVNTGVIKDSKISIDAKSFEKYEFDGKTDFFDSVEFRLPLLWALRNCINHLQINSKHEYCDVQHNESGSTSTTTVSIRKPSGAQSLEMLLFQHGDESVNLSTIVRTLKSLSESVDQFSDIKVVVNSPLSVSAESFISGAYAGKFSSRFFRRSKEKLTGLPICDLALIFKKISIESLEDYYARNNKGVSIMNDISGIISDSFKALVVYFNELANETDSFRIDAEQLYLRLGAEHESELIPAPPVFEKLAVNSLRVEQLAILTSIISDKSNAIVHALGGVGKTVTARLFKDSLPEGSIAVLYDCFGDGLYRSMNSPRHSENIVLRQIVNELALQGMCEPLIASSVRAPANSLASEFSRRIEEAVSRIRVQNSQAQILIFIDAADNAVMAARERSEQTIVAELINRLQIDGCKVIGFCRTERRSFLEPSISVKQYELSPFTFEESLSHLKAFFPTASLDDGTEFHRLSGGNPRVQATAISFHSDSLVSVLQELGPNLSTVDQQIESQLNSAINRLKQKNVEGEAEKIDLICTALASLPPFIPIDVLALITNFDVANIKSFISDIGRGLLLLDDTVQFRDEPTESWFRETFTATPEQALAFVGKIESLAYQNSYVAESLPFLMSRGGNTQALIDLALSEDFLPQNNPIDARSILNSRLKFALQAAIKFDMFVDVAKLLMRTGEESAGDDRQYSLLGDNVALVADVQSPTEVQKLAFKGQLTGAWQGSGNLYKASLLSRFTEYRGEATTFLRAAEKWLEKYFDERNVNEDDVNNKDLLTDTDITEFFFAYLNLFGATKAISTILKWSPKDGMHSTIRRLSSRLYDSNRKDALYELARESARHPYICVHFVERLYELEHRFDTNILETCASQILNSSESEIDAQNRLPITSIVSFIECCYSHNINLQLLKEISSRYLKLEPKSWWGESIRHESEWIPYIKSEAIRAIVAELDFKIDSVLPKSFKENTENSYKNKKEEESYKKLVGATIPLEMFRIKVRANKVKNFDEELKRAASQSKSYHVSRYYDGKVLDKYIESLHFDTLFFSENSNEAKMNEIERFLQGEIKLSYSFLIIALATASRVQRHIHLVDRLEECVLGFAASIKKEDPESFSKFWIDLAKAILPQGRTQSSIYFNNAIEAVSKYGDEALSRFMAIFSFAKFSGKTSSELVHRFARCTELVGDDVREKHFPRAEALNVMHDMHESSAFSVLARWLDREVIYMGRVQPYLMGHAVESNSIEGPVAWASIGFIDWYPFSNFLSSCISKTNESSIQKIIFEDAVNQALLRELDYSELSQLLNIGKKVGLSDSTLELALEAMSKPEEPDHHLLSDKKSDPFDWKTLFANYSLNTSSEILGVYKRFSETKDRPSVSEFWREFYAKKSAASGSEVLEEISKCKFDAVYDLETALEAMPEIWFSREAIGKKWEELFCQVVEQKHSYFANPWWHHWSLEKYRDISRIKKLRNRGILNALKKNLYSSDPESLFSLATVIAEFLTSKESQQALEYSLTRFELHVDDSDADGDWDGKLAPFDSATKSYCAFLMSALANPSSEVRWQAVHSIRRLVLLNCAKEIGHLFELYHSESIGAYGAKRYPYYKYYAKMFFLIGLYRGIIDNPSILIDHKETLLNIALTGDHILIEKLAAEICISVNEKCEGVFNVGEIERLKNVTKSQLTYTKVSKAEKVSRSSRDKISSRNRRDISFFMDFEEYWLIPLKNYFDVSFEELEALISDIAIEEWGLSVSNYSVEDRRTEMWRDGRKETYASHSEIPATERFSFYLGYHIIFLLASRLLKTTRLAVLEDWDTSTFEDWLNDHYLTLGKGNLLSDLRAPPPSKRRSWIGQDIAESWQWEVKREDFLEGLLARKGEKTYLCISGYWNDTKDSYNEETYRVSTALASDSTVKNLLSALLSCNDFSDYRLPKYGEDDFDIEDADFKLKGWISQSHDYKKLDESDPHAAELPFPSKEVAVELLDSLGLSFDSLTGKIVNSSKLLCGYREVWTTPNSADRHQERFFRNGSRIYLSLETLKELCEKRKIALVFKVEIRRRRSYYSGQEGIPDEVKHPRPYCNLYCFRGNGVIADQYTSYQLR